MGGSLSNLYGIDVAAKQASEAEPYGFDLGGGGKDPYAFDLGGGNSAKKDPYAFELGSKDNSDPYAFDLDGPAKKKKQGNDPYSFDFDEAPKGAAAKKKYFFEALVGV